MAGILDWHSIPGATTRSEFSTSTRWARSSPAAGHEHSARSPPVRPVSAAPWPASGRRTQTPGRQPPRPAADAARPHRRPAGSAPLSDAQLQRVAQDVRELIIDTIGEIGGHFGANLGTCELAVAVHSLLDSPRDKVLWDVGHQAYPHKILTGRRSAPADDPPVRRPGAVLLDRRVRARHHRRRSRLDLDLVRGRDQAGDAARRAARRARSSP